MITIEGKVTKHHPANDDALSSRYLLMRTSPSAAIVLHKEMQYCIVAGTCVKAVSNGGPFLPLKKNQNLHPVTIRPD